MAGFVECLESEEAEEGAEKVDGERKYLVTSVPFLQQLSLSSLCQCCQTQNIIFLNYQN